MKLINYVEYKHYYAHALEPKLKAINCHANVQHKPVKYIKKIINKNKNIHKRKQLVTTNIISKISII